MSDVPWLVWLLALAWIVSLVAVAAMWRKNDGLTEDLVEAHQDVRILQAAVSEAEVTFRRYATIHSHKQTQEGEAKAIANRRLAEKMKDALDDTGYHWVSPVQNALQEIARRVDVSNV